MDESDECWWADELEDRDPSVEARLHEFIGALRLAVALPPRAVAMPARAA